MASFDKYSNYKDNAGVSGVVFGAEKPLLEVELNEMQEVQKTMLRRAIKNILGDGVTDISKVVYEGGALKIKEGCSLAVDGYLVQCTGLSISASAGETVYLQVWEDTATYGDTLKTEGNQQSSSAVTNFIKDNRSQAETSRRKVVKYTLAKTTDSAKHNLKIATIESNGYMTKQVREVNYFKLQNQVIDLRVQMGTLDNGVLGVEHDLENNTHTRIGDNENWTPGNDYNRSEIYAGRVRCCVTDDGVVVAKYGDEAYTETGALTVAVTDGDTTYPIGTKLQNLVWQPAFYYKRIPLKLIKQVDKTYQVKGYHMTKWVDLISPVSREGFKLHPACMIGTEELEGYFIGENDGILELSDGSYDMTDSAALASSPYTGQKFSSIAGAKPASGASVAGVSATGNKNLTRDAVRKLCANRGEDWQQEDITIASAEQLLFSIEYATLNIQNTELGAGVTSLPYVSNVNDAVPNPVNTDLGNGSGKITVQYTHSNGTTYTVYVPVYRGVKNPYGNIWKFIDGFLRKNSASSDCNEAFWQDGSKAFSDNIADYIACGFSCATKEGYVKAFGYSEDCDFMFMTSLVGGDSNRPVGDYYWVNMSNNVYIALLGAGWYHGAAAGLFCWSLHDVASNRHCYVGGRLCRKSKKVHFVEVAA